MRKWGAASRGQIDDEVRWGAADIVAMCLAMLDTIGPGLLAIAGIMIALSIIATLFIK